MNYKKEISVIIFIAVIGILYGLFALCKPDSDLICRGIYQGIGTPLSIISFALILISSPLIFLKETVYKSWRRLAVIFLPLVLIAIFLTPEYSRNIFGIDREYVTLLTSGIFLASSYILILYKYIKSR